MATITATSFTGAKVAPTIVTLDGSSDTFTVNASKTQHLVLNNDSGGSITPTITGSTVASSVEVDGYSNQYEPTAYAVGTIADGTGVVIKVKDIRNLLSGTVTISAGSGLKAQLLEF